MVVAMIPPVKIRRDVYPLPLSHHLDSNYSASGRGSGTCATSMVVEHFECVLVVKPVMVGLVLFLGARGLRTLV
jgi:hypothetical protein